MSNTNDGGPAFPCPHSMHDQASGAVQNIAAEPGMTLKDWFAGQALVGILGSRRGFLVDCGTQNAPEWAYQVADAMLLHRKQEKLSSELAAKIDTLGLPVRAVNVLARLGCQTVGDVTRLDEMALIAAKNSGITTRRAIVRALEARGLSLAARGGVA